MPEGLLMYGPVLSDIFSRFTPVLSVVIQGDVTYGACCVDDLGAQAMGCDFLVHYGHSCLVPLSKTVVPCLYVFVEIRVDSDHAAECLKRTIPRGSKVSVMGTVQFRDAIFSCMSNLTLAGHPCVVPQAKPLSPGEVLGCTAPRGLYDEGLGEGEQCMLFIADGRFHLEAAMIANPRLKAYRYDPYGKVLTEEGYEFGRMVELRDKAIGDAEDAEVFGVILGTLGRQGNPAILNKVLGVLRDRGKKTFVVLLSEVRRGVRVTRAWGLGGRKG
jgi:2-(3-amino-3-carboxypropyl)histidine synthase